MVVRHLTLLVKVMETKVHQTAKDISTGTHLVIDSTLNFQRRSHMTNNSVFSQIKILIIYKKTDIDFEIINKHCLQMIQYLKTPNHLFLIVDILVLIALVAYS